MSDRTYVKRYTAAQRANHWVTAVSLVLLALSGLALFHPSLWFLSGLFGGGANVREFHPWIGLVLALSFLGLFFRFWRLNLWEKTDNIWLSRARAVLAGREEELPEVGKYNAGQKMVFWLMSILIVLLFLTGVVLWDAQHDWLAANLGLTFTIEQSRVAVLVHSMAAILAIVVWIVHVYAAIWVKGTISAMTRGEVTGGWGWRHHRRWLREEVTKERSTPAE